MKKTTPATSARATMSDRRSSPAGRWRMAVRGFWASMVRSMMRLADIPSVRALTMATVIQRIFSQAGKPLAARTMPE